jgi:hypothetical protein
MRRRCREGAKEEIVMNMTRRCFIALSLVWPIGAQAADLTCDQFKVGLTESSAQYQSGAPRYEFEGGTVRLKGWLVRGIFDDVNARMMCENDYFVDFLVDANSADDAFAAVHVGLFAGMALHAFGLEWPEALSVRDELVRTRRPATITELPVGEGVASMAISIAGISDFELNATR